MKLDVALGECSGLTGPLASGRRKRRRGASPRVSPAPQQAAQLAEVPLLVLSWGSPVDQEDEAELFSQRAQLFHFRDKERAEREPDDVKFLEHKKTDNIPCMIRQEGTFSKKDFLLFSFFGWPTGKRNLIYFHKDQVGKEIEKKRNNPPMHDWIAFCCHCT